MPNKKYRKTGIFKDRNGEDFGIIKSFCHPEESSTKDLSQMSKTLSGQVPNKLGDSSLAAQNDNKYTHF